MRVSLKIASPECMPSTSPDSKVHGANVGSIWGRQDSGGPHVSPMNLAVRVQVQVQVVMTKSQLADYTRRVMDGAEGVKRDQCDEEWDVQYKNREVRDREGRDKEGDESPSPGERC